MSTEMEFHFTIGPVQAFVAQARRTRDFWAGSFLLSYLSGVAMVAAQKGGAKILFPKPDKQFLSAIRREASPQSLPSQGSIPNRFSAEVTETFNATAVTDAVHSAWCALAKLIWEGDLESIATPETRVVWQGQVEHFWDITWVITPQNANALALETRKNMRTQYPPEQAGHKCALMAGWQELSGSLKPGKAHVREFWQTVKNTVKHKDIRPDEPLCAMAYIKRRFCHYFADLKVESHGFYLHGWKVPVSVPSVALMAAVPEIAHIGRTLVTAPSQELSTFESQWKAAGGQYGERSSLPKELQAIQDRMATKLCLDGNAWHPLVYQSPTTYELKPEKCAQTKKALTALYRRMELNPPSPFYAVLMMDGDSLGTQMSDPGKPKSISEALKTFTSSVKDIVDDAMGYLIYAGGDDVLAILPLDTATQCAIDIRQWYMQCFADVNSERKKNTAAQDREPIITSISAAIIYTHFKTPLTKILLAAHHVLDHCAKEGAGRDALAIRVEKPSGRALDWAQPWAHALIEDGTALAITAQFTKTLFGEVADAEASNSFIHKLRDRLQTLIATPNACNEADLTLLKHVISADLKQSSACQNLPITDIQKAVDTLLHQCIPHKRDGENNKPVPKGMPKIDGALLALFLASKGLSRIEGV
ncbi:type III-B CRISPR-associated protein Cas10/Cmr2 [Teredinibacter turnerae]|uniref:type III-B CRISPR-associated protein Cas10/Cmr2 n=1 Tax=Teredinibacter turnerae TaxID=2426 RepID=UPI0003F53898|nr:type III-B CRISPR-associated protein Cas10/Cmr2 [Teredinibacter turnerae]